MSISDELLARYFKGKCTPEESVKVATYLKEIDEFPSHLLIKEEWDDAEDALISKEKSDEMFAMIKKKSISKRKQLFKVISIAAITVVILSISLLLLNKPKSAIVNLTKNLKEKRIEQAQISWKSFVNYTSSNQSLELPDGTIVKVYPGGALRYAVPFVKNNREIYLKGKGFFEVAKDKKHPFIVYTKGISTTALGTSFTITAIEDSGVIKVELHTGKVWIKNTTKSNGTPSFSKILIPGSELVYDSVKRSINLLDKSMIVKEKVKPTEFNFTQVPLKYVFEKLEKQYNINIIYSETDVNEISFTGTIDLSRKPYKIMKEITELNKLNLTKTTEGYLISK